MIYIYRKRKDGCAIINIGNHMKNVFKKIGIILIGIIILVGGIFMVFQFMDKQKLKNEELESCFMTSGGGMLGGYSATRIKKQEDGSVTLTTEHKEIHSDRLKTTVYTVNPNVLNDIKEIVLKYDLYGASKRPRSDLVVLDGETTTIGFHFTEHYFSVPDDLILTNKMDEGYEEFIKYVVNIEKKNGIETIEPQSARLSINGYTFFFNVEEAFTDKLNTILEETDEVKDYEGKGIILKEVKNLDTTNGTENHEGEKATIVYEKESGQIILLYEDVEFDKPVVLLAELDDYTESALPHFKEMNGTYDFYFN